MKAIINDVKTSGLQERAQKFFLMVVNVTLEHVGEVQ
jgi:hypothetical protein